MKYTTSQGRIYRNGQLLLGNDIDPNNVKENLHVISTLTNLKWTDTEYVDNITGEVKKVIPGIKRLIYTMKGDTVAYKVYKLTLRVIDLGIKAYLRGELIIKSLIQAKHGILPYTHHGELPKAQREK